MQEKCFKNLGWAVKIAFFFNFVFEKCFYLQFLPTANFSLV